MFRAVELDELVAIVGTWCSSDGTRSSRLYREEHALPRLVAEFVFDRDLGADETIQRQHDLLADLAPTWAARLQIWKGPRHQIDVRREHFKEAVLEAVSARGKTYRDRVKRFGAGEGEQRTFGSVEIRGGTPALVAVISTDSDPLWRIGGKLLLGNSIVLEVKREKVEELASPDWIRAFFKEACESTSPAWGAVYTLAEYEVKVMGEGAGAVAVGRDFSRFLPGVFVVNFFGQPYVDLFGGDCLLATPGVEAQRIDSGVSLDFGGSVASWNTVDVQRRMERALDHLGADAFFDKRAPRQRRRVPVWNRSRLA